MLSGFLSSYSKKKQSKQLAAENVNRSSDAKTLRLALMLGWNISSNWRNLSHEGEGGYKERGACMSYIGMHVTKGWGLYGLFIFGYWLLSETVGMCGIAYKDVWLPWLYTGLWFITIVVINCQGDLAFDQENNLYNWQQTPHRNSDLKESFHRSRWASLSSVNRLTDLNMASSNIVELHISSKYTSLSVYCIPRKQVQ